MLEYWIIGDSMKKQIFWNTLYPAAVWISLGLASYPYWTGWSTKMETGAIEHSASTSKSEMVSGDATAIPPSDIP